MINQLGDDIDAYTCARREFCCNAIVGFNFGDGHLHDERLIEAIQKRCRFAPGRVHRRVGRVRADRPAATRSTGSWTPRSASSSAASGRSPTRSPSSRGCRTGRSAPSVTWRMPGYERVSHRAPERAAHRRRRKACGDRMTAAVVVGSGPNGLAAALTLAAEGVDVTRARGRRRARRRDAQQRADAAGPDPRRVLGRAPARGRLAVLAAVRPGGARASTGAGRRSSTPTRSTAARGAAALRSVERDRCGARRDGRRWRVAVRAARRSASTDIDAGLPAADAARAVAPGAAGAVRACARRCRRRCSRAAGRHREARALLGGVAAHAFRPFAAPMSSAVGVALGTAAHRLRLAGRRGRLGGDQPRDDRRCSSEHGAQARDRCAGRRRSTSSARPTS